MALIYAYKSRNLTKDIVMLNGANAVVTAVPADKIRAIIGREGQILADLSGAFLVVTSVAPTANGSTFSLNVPSSGTNRLRIAMADLALLVSGVYSLIVDYCDSNDNNEWKNVSRQVLAVEDT